MDEHVKDYIEKYPSEVTAVFNELRELIYDSMAQNRGKIEEQFWAKLPSYYVGK